MIYKMMPYKREGDVLKPARNKYTTILANNEIKNRGSVVDEALKRSEKDAETEGIHNYAGFILYSCVIDHPTYPGEEIYSTLPSQTPAHNSRLPVFYNRSTGYDIKAMVSLLDAMEETAIMIADTVCPEGYFLEYILEEETVTVRFTSNEGDDCRVFPIEAFFTDWSSFVNKKEGVK
jgi:hypothetical protein